ncbi:MAG: CRISPR-associated helicase Cas3' [Actinobacteria bacterium]|nr:CRISPR-associated helicase Cas3' [Actinomycetota bacterium]
MSQYWAHSANKAGNKQTIKDHLLAVSRLINDFLADSVIGSEATLAGLMHDFGKYGDLFQLRLQGKAQGIDHWSAGAWEAILNYRSVAAALAIEGHHIGLQHLNKQYLSSLDPRKLVVNHPLQLRLSENDLFILRERMSADELVAMLPGNTKVDTGIESSIRRMLDIRFIYSALVDADYLDTEAHFNGDEKGKCYRKPGPALRAQQSLEAVLAHIENIRRDTMASDNVVEVRSALLADCLKAAEDETGLFTLTAPTGSGKTLAMLAFAMKHATKNNLRRIVFVIPYLSITEQTAAIYCSILADHFGEDYVLEQHSMAGFGAEPDKNITDNDGESREKAIADRHRRLLSENWDAPIIVTTSVQMLESLFSNRPSACRKLHRLERAVVLFDEVQTLPSGLTIPTLAALSHLVHGYGSTVVFSTATQPAFDHLDNSIRTHSKSGWQPTEIVSQPADLFDRLQRTKVIWDDPDGSVDWPKLSGWIRNNKQALCIVNLKRHAQDLCESLGKETLRLSTNMCPAHRREVLNIVRKRLKEKHPVYLVATQCIEAGVDVDFPIVYRAYAPLDSIIQAAGRCNREGSLREKGLMHIFMPEDEAYPSGGGYKQAAQITKMLLREVGADNMELDNPSFIKAYYRKLYDIAKPDMSSETNEILNFVRAGSFPDIARLYRLIKQDTINVLVPYEAMIAEFKSLSNLANRTGLTTGWIKAARALTISMYRPNNDDAIWDVLIPVKTAERKVRGGGDWFIYAVQEDYDARLGLVPSGALNTWIG